jgi:hypothetical protein
MKHQPHRDDLPYEDVEKIEAEFAKLYPGYKVVFQGDVEGQLTDEERAIAEMKERWLQYRFARTFMEGRCHLCGVKWGGSWPPPFAKDGTEAYSDDDEAFMEFKAGMEQQGWEYTRPGMPGDGVPMVTCPDCCVPGVPLPFKDIEDWGSYEDQQEWVRGMADAFDEEGDDGDV